MNKIKRTPINGENIYDSHNYNLNKLYSDNLAFDRYILARNPMKSLLIPNYYNQFKEAHKEAVRFKHDYIKSAMEKELDWQKYLKSNKIVESFNGNFVSNKIFNKPTLLFIFLIIFIFLFLYFY